MPKKIYIVTACVLFGFTVALVFPFLLCTSVSGQDEPPQLLMATPDPGINWGNAKINAPMLWALHYTGKGVRVAVVDTGIDYEHPALMLSPNSNGDNATGDNIPVINFAAPTLTP